MPLYRNCIIFALLNNNIHSKPAVMKKFLRILLKVLLSILGLVILFGIIAAFYLHFSFISVEKNAFYQGEDVISAFA